MRHVAVWDPLPCRCVQPLLGVPQSVLNALDLAVNQQRPGIPNAEHGPDADQLVGKRLDPATHRALLPAPPHRRNRSLDQVRRSSEVLGWPARGGSPRTARRSPRTTRSPAGAGQERRRAARPADAPAERQRRAGDSDTTGGGRPAGPGTGSPRSSATSLALPPSWPVTASHSEPLSRSRMEVCSRKLRTCSG